MAGRVVRAYGKGGEKGFDGAVTRLMMQMYLCNCDFRKRLIKKGRSTAGTWLSIPRWSTYTDMIM